MDYAAQSMNALKKNQSMAPPDRAAAVGSNAPHGHNELSLIHEMFPAFAVAPSSPPALSQSNNNNLFGNQGG